MNIVLSVIKPFFAALTFLTVAPAPGVLRGDGRDMARSLPWFVPVGALIGLGVAWFDAGARALLPSSTAAALSLLAMAAVSKALHLDGLADTADGFFSSRPRERILEIMKDSRTGAMGVVAIVFVLLIKYSAVSALPDGIRFRTLFLMPVAGRFAPVFMFAVMKYVRGETGLGAVFTKGATKIAFAVSIVMFAAISYGAAGYAGLLIAGGIVVFVALFATWCHSKIGGYTGDTLGAAVELCEMAAAIAALVISGLRLFS